MAAGVSSTKRKSKRAKNNLGNFDVDQIYAELSEIEAKSLELDHPVKRSAAGTSETKEASKPANNHKPREVNEVGFTPSGSKVLHKLSRTSPQKSSPVKKIPAPVKRTASNPKLNSQKKTVPKKKGPTVLKFNRPKPGVARTMDAVKPKVSSAGAKNESKAKPRESKPEITSGVNKTAVALKGLKYASEFNAYALKTHKRSLHNDVERANLFHEPPELAKMKTEVSPKTAHAVYYDNRKAKMLGGVEQHNLGPGKVKKALTNRAVKLLTPTLLVVAVVGYLFYLNMPNINLKMAANRSGVAVSQPSYSPEGYSLRGPIESETGRVAVSYTSNEDKAYSITQEVSQWDSQALLENKVKKETEEYSAYTDRGLTIYVYEDKATWINQGKVNEIADKGADLSVEDMVRIAGSM